MLYRPRFFTATPPTRNTAATQMLLLAYPVSKGTGFDRLRSVPSLLRKIQGFKSCDIGHGFYFWQPPCIQSYHIPKDTVTLTKPPQQHSTRG